jgi:hypothetical protein
VPHSTSRRVSLFPTAFLIGWVPQAPLWNIACTLLGLQALQISTQITRKVILLQHKQYRIPPLLYFGVFGSSTQIQVIMRYDGTLVTITTISNTIIRTRDRFFALFQINQMFYPHQNCNYQCNVNTIDYPLPLATP